MSKYSGVAHNATASPPTKSPANTNAPHPLTTSDSPVKGMGLPLKVPLCFVVLLYIIVPLPVGVAVPLTLAAVYEPVALTCLYASNGAHTFEAYASVAAIAAISNYSATNDTKCSKGSKLPSPSAALQFLVLHLLNTAA